MNIIMNRIPVQGPWGGGNGAVAALYGSTIKVTPHVQGVVSLFDIALVMGLERENGCPSLEDVINEAKPLQKPVVLRVNDCDARKGTVTVDKRLIAASQYLHGTIFVSQWMHDYFMEKGWACKKNTVIVNGVNGEFFKPAEPKLLDHRQLVQPRPVKIVTHHWSDNPMKGQDYVEWLDDFVGRHKEQFRYTYVGRTKAQLKNSTYVPPKWGAELGAELASHDICVNASRFDPGPNSVIESIACGLPTYVHREGGGGTEFAGLDHAFSSFKELEKILLSGNYQANSFSLRTWYQFANDVYAFMKEVSDE